MNMNIVPDDVVISGIGGLFPEAKNVVELRQRLYENKNLVQSTRYADSNLNVCPYIGVIDSDHFDNSFFGIHKQQCKFMDPMQRIIMESTFAALVDAGVNPKEIRGKRVGVFMASTIGENDNLFLESVVSGFGVVGHSKAMIPARISYFFNLQGPSILYDCNWISGMEILRQAYVAIKTGRCDSVIVGTVVVSTHDEFQWLFQDMGFLSKDGCTRAFDAEAVGYGRAEGSVVMYLQRASEAKRSYCSVAHIATKMDGTHTGDILNMEEASLTEFLEEFYEECPINKEQIDYVETYGCGLKDIDKNELNSLEKIYCSNRNKPLLITASKSITGHNETGSAMFSIVQVILAMEEGVIPATLNYKTPNPDIPGLTNGHFDVVTENRKWSGEYAAVNALGVDSYFGHLVLKANPKKKVQKELVIPTLLLASTRTEEGIKAILETLKSKPKDPEYYNLIHNFFSEAIQGHLHRGYLLLSEVGEPKQETIFYQGNKKPIWFVYSGMGSQWTGMLGDFMKIEVFANSIKKSHETIATKGLDLMNIITTSDKTVFDNILNCFVGIAAIQIALTDVLRSLEIVPDGIIGHSVGELGCAYADGCMTAEQMILSSYYRGLASLEADLIRGMMAAVGLGYNQIKDRLPPTIEVACRNSSESCTISGPTEDMEEFVKQLQDEGIFTRLVNVGNIAYHSRYVKPAGSIFLTYMKTVLPTPVPRSSKWISTSNPETDWNSHLAKHSSAEYHTNNQLSPVMFEEGTKYIPEDAILIEIAPHGLLQAILKRSLLSATNFPLAKRKCESSVEFLLDTFGKLYLDGVEMKLSKIYPDIEYPVSRNTPSLSDLVYWNHSDNWKKEIDASAIGYGVKDILITLRSEHFKDCVGHRLDDKFILPTSTYLDLLLQCAGGRTDVIFENLHFKKSLVIPKIGFLPFNAMVREGSGELEIYSGHDLILTGKMIFPIAEEEFELDKAKVQLECNDALLTESDFYNEMQHRGCDYSGMFKTLKNLTLSGEGSVSTVEWKNNWTFLLEAMLQQQLFHDGETNQEIRVPRFIQRIALSLPLLPIQVTETEVTFEYATSTISTEGIEISRMTTVPLERDQDRVLFDSVECIPLKNTYNKIEAAIHFAIQLAATDDIGQEETTIFLSELETENPLASCIKKVASELQSIHLNFSPVEEVSHIIPHRANIQLFVVNGPASEDILRLTISSGALLLTKAQDALLSHPQLFPVAQFRVGVDEYVVLKKIVEENTRIITVKGDTLSTKDLERSSSSWARELHAAIAESFGNQNKICLLTTLVPVEGFYNFVQELKSLPNTKNVKVIFNLDKKPLDPNVTLQRDLTLTILKGGAWYTYLPFLTQYRDDIKLADYSCSGLPEDQTIEYLGINLKDETLNPASEKKNELGNIDWAGVTKNGTRVMGLAKLDGITSKLVLDSKLSWPVPKEWSLVDGATVPHAFTSAYYMLNIVGRIKYGETVFIHGGCTPVGLAASAIANDSGCVVHVSVSTYNQKAFLRKKYGFLQEANIIFADDASFQKQLMEATNGKGADVLLNCVSGNLINTSMDCIAPFGRFIHYGKYDPEEGNSFGMYCFLQNISFHVVDLNNIFSRTKEIKEELRKLVTIGMETLVVTPIIREVMTRNDIDNLLRKIKSSKHSGKVVLKLNNDFSARKLNVHKPNRFICDKKRSYLVCGGSAEMWTDVVEWLVQHGAKRIIVSVEAKPTQNYILRRLNLLQSHFEADIIVTISKAGTEEGAARLLADVLTLGLLHLVFTLPNRTTKSEASDAGPVQFLDCALRKTAPKAVLVNFVSWAAGLCHTRVKAGFATYTIQWPKSLNISDAISILDKVLFWRLSDVLAKKIQTDEDDISIQGIIKDLANVIPTIEEIISEQKNATKEPEWVQVVSEGPRVIRGVPPVFIVPGMTGQRVLEGMVCKLLFPTFVTVPPVSSWPIDKMAEVYAKKMWAIYPKGVFNMIILSSGGVLAIEIAKILQREKGHVHFFFIDSAPRKIHQALQTLGEDRDHQDINLSKMIFDIKDAEVMKKLESNTDWNSRLDICLGGYEGTKCQKTSLRAGLLRLQDQINTIFAYRPNGDLLSGNVHLLVPNEANQYDNCELESHLRSPPVVTLVPGDHLSITSHKITIDYINQNHWII